MNQALDIFGNDIKPNISLQVMSNNQDLSSLGAKVLLEVDNLIELWHPHLLLVQGDTTTVLMAGLAAFHRGVPVGHVEAGLRTHDIHQPFPEELNRQAISNLASFHFAATELAARNLGYGRRHVYVTGNTVVDALQIVFHKLSRLSENQPVFEFMNKVKNRIEPGKNSSLVWCLLTIHRRESFGDLMEKILKAVLQMLKENPNLVIVFPVHPNPSVRAALSRVVPGVSVSSILNAADQETRFFLVEPLAYTDLIQLVNLSCFVLTDSGGIQEEAASMGRPTLVLRETTERVEGILAGAARLVGAGSDPDLIVREGSLLANNSTLRDFMASKGRGLYGIGNAASIIVDTIRSNSESLLRGEAVWTQWNTSTRLTSSSPFRPSISSSWRPHFIERRLVSLCQFVVVVTVWRRQTLQLQLEMLQEQGLDDCPISDVFVFQNGNYIDVSGIILDWNRKDAKFKIMYIQSKVQTGYYGRFLAPLMAHQASHENLYFAILDDDVIFGSRYFENCKRIVEFENALCTRNGRFVQPQGNGMWLEHLGSSGRGWNYDGQPATWDEDVIYDFGGHIWIGRLSWLREVWRHPPPIIETLEDFWISAVLKTSWNVSTVRPKCPSPKAGGDIQLCACSMIGAGQEFSTTVEVGSGQVRGRISDRNTLLKPMMQHFSTLKTIPMLDPNFLAREARSYAFPAAGSTDALKVDGTRFSKCKWFM
jgi:UDP-N-acetylglucosamine 2-epimerase (non-hydrolysing)